ncbi:uncharacterized protein [Mytilus edulis]|uniref:uncharacterized protein isoform X2 n=1 Tax=Mytilus edulis TaxID=6550 RepID=UPI0039F071CE
MFTYIGCFKDRGSRRLLHVGPFTTANNEMSTNICFNHCNPKNYEYFATKLKYHCFCGNGTNISSDQNPRTHEIDCYMKCRGHPSMNCGGIWAASVYKIIRKGPMVSTTEHTLTIPEQSQSVIGIGIGLTIVVFLSIVAAVSFLFWRRREQKANIKESRGHEYDGNQNVSISDSSSNELHVYEKCHTYGNSNSNKTTRISNGYIEPQTCSTTANHVHRKPVTDQGHAQDKLDKRSIIKNMLPSLQHNYFKLVNDITGKVKRDHIADTSQTELHLTASGSNGAYAILDSTATGFSKGKRFLPRNEQTNYQIKLEKKNHLIKGDEDYCCVEGEYNTLNKIRRFFNEGSLYSHSVDGVYDISGNNNQSKTTDHTYDHAIGSQTVIATDYDHVF